ncbi:SGNH/GDSL hydrolase family protein [Ilumatobacter coccineus]|uniref:SGNH hydrolase-type esterase domain-containing protein n=1 Tax=Ilumatobacter coccineus (strain NBRC 103263 / KCTC 29153 / YM16-304) TaxID=1313172 RepID=A0A6C7E9X9_ILUCY|nr:SGNH/GDSL hydrolase family protein [Ilumatobacter coccineus]BAN01945.1 hypothetical protein YM304_16310 [Ilumatobacter coccineus YM16-304]
MVHRSQRIGPSPVTRTIATVLTLTVALLAATLAVPAPAAAAPPLPDDTGVDATSRYRALEPCRLADTRNGTGFVAVDDRTSRVDLQRCEIPSTATAIVATTTIVNATRGGWLVAYPSGTARPDAATLNWSAGMTRGNSATIAAGDDFAIELFRSDGAGNGHVVIDVVGAFVPAETSARGRFVAADDGTRLLDTRDASAAPTRPTTHRVGLPESVPAGVDALAVTFTLVDTTAPTYLTAYAAGGERPLASVLNADGAGQFRSAATIVPVSDDGFDVFVSAGSHVVIDMTGWFTGPSADVSADGLFVAIAPQRLRDTRSEPQALYDGGSTEILPPADLIGDGSTGPAALAFSMTMVGADDRGYVTAYAARTERPAIASGYSLRNQVTAQFALTPVSEFGLAFFTEQGTDVTVDLLGWFTGPPATATETEPAPNPQRPLRVLAVGDSTMAGVRWYRALGALTGASWTFAGESCRRLVRWSCNGREDRTPPTALRTIETMPDVFDVLVMMTGYNDRANTFEADLERIMAAARAQGIRRVVWLSYSREFRSDKGGPGASQVYEFHNVLLRAAAERHDDLVVAEWATVARNRPEWVHYDGIHFTDDGAYGNADFMSRAVAHATGQPCPLPYTVGGELTEVCADPGTVPSPDVRSLYGFVDTVTQCWEVGPSRTVECVQDPYTY